VVLENPYDVFGDLKMQRAKDLYDELDYVGAFRVLDELSRQTSTPETYEARSTLCDAYAAWDDWRIPQAIEKLSDSIQAIQRYRRNNPATPLSNQKDILQEQLDLLRRLNDAMSLDIKVAEQQFHLLTTPQLYQPLIGTLRAGALRQEKRGKFDVAALLWYRLIELFSQRRLSQYGVLSGQPEYDKTAIDLDILLKRYQIAYGSKKGKSAPPERLPREISLLDGYALLIALTDPLVQNLHLGTIRNQISVRNLGIFAHGFKPLKREDYSQFKSLATTLSERFFEIEQEFSSDWDKATFIESI
jgi:CRISPR-associated protein (TIGR02710 family)